MKPITHLTCYQFGCMERSNATEWWLWTRINFKQYWSTQQSCFDSVIMQIFPTNSHTQNQRTQMTCLVTIKNKPLVKVQ
jgi:hypothetical protein